MWYVNNVAVEVEEVQKTNPFGMLDHLNGESNMFWFAESVTAEYMEQRVSCNLVLVTKCDSKWYIRAFLNPLKSTSAPLISMPEQRDIIDALLRPRGKSQDAIVAQSPVKLPKSAARAQAHMIRLSNRLYEAYPLRGMAGGLMCVMLPADSRILISSHLSDLMWKILGTITAWSAEIYEDANPVLVEEGVAGNRGTMAQAPRQRRIFEPEEVFAIKRTRYPSPGSGKPTSGESGRGSWEHDPHTRKKHIRRRWGHRKLPLEQQEWIEIPEARVRSDKDPSPGVAPGTLVKGKKQ